MNIEIFTGVAPDFKPLTVVDIHCTRCGRPFRIPVDSLYRQVTDALDEHYKKQVDYYVKENARLRSIIETGNQIELIRRMADRL